ncbi:Sec-independent protein translocase protein TatB [Robiginitomaculum antarcticum]|uniref:Sec-independent protein translocase protein TatB n=1 Tax=Robiginitomaculum antarcticum TaxID=437507 RepID=UPI0003A0B19D|nr:Sec-independent protein translocase protein TatB [Robiginitomaculum antarcticum]
MLPSLGMFEMLIIGLIAIIVVGPKDLPAMMRKIGQFTRKIRELGNEFKSAFDDIGRETDLDDLRKEIADLRSLGKIGELSDKAFESEMRALDADIREGTSLSHPRTAPAKPAESAPLKAQTPVIDTPDPAKVKAASKPKAKPKTKTSAKPKAKTAAKATAKPKPKSTGTEKTAAKPKPKPKPEAG